MQQLCRHIKTNGIQCQSPALLYQRFCYHHQRLNASHRNFRPNTHLDPFFEAGRHIRLVPIEDRHSALVALSQTVNAMAAGQIELKHAKGILYGLNLALQSIKQQEAHPELAPDPNAMVQNVIHSEDKIDIVPIDPELAAANRQALAAQIRQNQAAQAQITIDHSKQLTGPPADKLAG